MNRYASKHDLIDLVSSGMEESGLPAQGATYVAATSGGVDSMVLLWILAKALNVQAIAAHINYGMRGAESDADEELVELFCREHSIPFEVIRSPESAMSGESGGNFQNQARMIRRKFLVHVMNKYNAGTVMLAHHRDDQIETVFQKLLRGAAPEKWIGMQRYDPPWMRPLLEATKEELHHFAEKHAIPYRTDRSNLESNYSRNVLRNDVFPLFDRMIPGWDQNIGRLARAGHLHAVMLDHITRLITEYRSHATGDSSDKGLGNVPASESETETENETAMNRSAWLSLPSELHLPLARHWIEKQTGYIGWSKGEVERLEDLKTLQTGKSIPFDDRFSVLRDRDRFVIFFSRAPGIRHNLSLTRISQRPEAASGLIFTESRYDPALKTGALQLAMDALPDELVLRTWKKGDRIQPLGMSGFQSIADHLTNRKVTAVQKNESLVLVSFEGKVHAVIFPHRLDSGEFGTIAEHTRCHSKGQRVLLIKIPDHLS